jgi:predicted phosphoribosyltransferase
MTPRFHDRREAGRVLAGLLARYRDDPHVVVLGLPRGGVPVAFEVAQALHAPLDVFVVRKLGLPGHEEFAMGAIASGAVRVDNPDVAPLAVPQALVDRVLARERAELARRETLYRGDRPPLALRGRTVILVDDGLATGTSMRAAVAAVRLSAPGRLVVAVPVAAVDANDLLAPGVDAAREHAALRRRAVAGLGGDAAGCDAHLLEERDQPRAGVVAPHDADRDR